MTSSICVMELRFGAMRRDDGPTLWARLDQQVLSRVRVVPFDESAALHAGAILAELERAGQTIGVEDAQIAATARSAGLVVVSANTRHFSRVSGIPPNLSAGLRRGAYADLRHGVRVRLVE